jgi:DNA polymerase-3 subunit delta
MTPEQFLSRLTKQPIAAAYLFLGAEGYQRRICKEALLNRVLPGELRLEGLTQVDLQDLSVTEVLDDARSLSLFAQERVIWVTGAENALPRRLKADSEDGESPEKSATAALSPYIKAPTPGTVIVFECSRYEFSGDDRAKLERVEKFFSPVRATVEFRPFTPEASRLLAQDLARQHKLQLGGAELAALLDAVAGDANRLAAEMEKLSLFVGADRKVAMDDLRALTPNASQTTIFALVNALGRKDRAGALRSLDILIREGEYLPLALTFLSTQFRLALAAKESKVASAQQAQGFFANLGVRIWRDRIEQVMDTAAAFTTAQLSKGLSLIYETDRKFRDNYKDDRIVMETLVLALTQ